MAKIVEIDPDKKYVLIGNFIMEQARMLGELWRQDGKLIIITGQDDIAIIPADQVIGYKILGEKENG